MRDLLVLGIFAVWAIFAVRRTWLAILLWTWVSIMNPHRLTFGFIHDAPLAAITAGVVAVSMLFSRHELKLRLSGPVIVLITLVAWMCITTTTALNGDAALDQLAKVLKIQLMTVVALAAIHDRRTINLFVWVNAASIGFFGVKGGLFTLAGGGKAMVFGPPGGFIAGNNEIGLAIILIIPLLNYLRLHAKNRWTKWGLLASMVLSAAAALGTQSRGAFLALAAMGLLLWIRSPRKALGASIMLAVTVGLLVFMPDSWTTRMNTIETYELDSSALGRINAWHFAVNLANDRPLVGGGFENTTPQLFLKYAPNPGDIHVAHSIYFQMLGEHGYPGLILFVLIGIGGYRAASQLRKITKYNPDDRWMFDLAGMCQVSMVGYAVGGAFLSLAYFDLPYNIIVILMATLDLVRRRTQQESRSKAPADRLARDHRAPASAIGHR